MRIGIISPHPILTIALVERLGLENSVSDAGEGFTVYEKGALILVENTSDILQTYSYLQNTFLPGRTFFVTFAFGVNNERVIGDVVFPNVFLGVHPDLAHSMVDETNQNAFFTESYFLEQYEEQHDYDFGKFSLSVGGISVTEKSELLKDAEFLEKVRLAYEPDTLDSLSLDVIHHAKENNWDRELYVVQGLLTGKLTTEVSAEQIEQYVAENIANITKFFIDNFLEGREGMTLEEVK